MKKKLLIISDLHSGHKVGLTPACYDSKPAERKEHESKLYNIRREIWKWYDKEVKRFKPDILIVNGDCIDGRGEASGGRELLCINQAEQVDYAVECIKHIGAKKVFMVYGTAYHTGKLQDYEDDIANKVNAVKIGSHEWIDVNGCIFDCKHHIGGSGIPHGRATAVLKEKLWNSLWAEQKDQPKANIIIRSHVHTEIGIMTGGVLCITTPALQGMGSIYGARRCSGTVSVGITEFEVEENGEYNWNFNMAKIKSQKARVTKA